MKKISFFWKFANGRTDGTPGRGRNACTYLGTVFHKCNFHHFASNAISELLLLLLYFSLRSLSRCEESICYFTVFENHRKSLIQHCERSELSKSSAKLSKTSAKPQQNLSKKLRKLKNWNETFWVIFNQCVLLQKQDDGGVKHEFQIPTAKFTIHKDESICKTSLKAALTSEAICQIPKFFFVIFYICKFS